MISPGDPAGRSIEDAARRRGTGSADNRWVSDRTRPAGTSKRAHHGREIGGRGRACEDDPCVELQSLRAGTASGSRVNLARLEKAGGQLCRPLE